ncbi:hypothetical protein PGB34_21390 [Xenophilus arseniciresistens]|uniref:Uncharacterized protein n=1 Tax=Xenophilus arseniciresistens TaxID=1283306 RepID=A0AAE3NEQ6_9BURK|nr:PhaM family polyhydroxyalkanoate granule multifunctional regulatory protein [Xenophilus arseniciresistens]MDA7418932.1 hypothetical protein [Xenophilus arseniciresistens]
MTDAAKPFAFSQFVPGFDFLRSLTGAGAGGAVPGLSGLSSWVAPTLSVEELDKRIHELKTVQYWLEQNVHALKATIQALEVQKMTLSTLQGMNVRMEDLANAFTRSTASAAAAMREAAGPGPASAPAPQSSAAPEPEPQAEVEAEAAAEAPAPEAEAVEPPSAKKKGGAKAAPGAAGVVDTLQWWNSLTQQFQQIASHAMQDAAQLRMPIVPGVAPAAAASPAASKKAAAAKPANKPTTAARKGAGAPKAKGGTRATPARKSPAAPRR